jgi:hypothetical protein
MRVLIALITNGATQAPKSASNCGDRTSGWRSFGAVPGGQSEYGSASSLRSAGSLAASLITFIRLAAVPPEKPPRIALTRILTRVHGTPKVRRASRCRK